MKQIWLVKHVYQLAVEWYMSMNQLNMLAFILQQFSSKLATDLAGS